MAISTNSFNEDSDVASDATEKANNADNAGEQPQPVPYSPPPRTDLSDKPDKELDKHPLGAGASDTNDPRIEGE